MPCAHQALIRSLIFFREKELSVAHGGIIEQYPGSERMGFRIRVSSHIEQTKRINRKVPRLYDKDSILRYRDKLLGD